MMRERLRREEMLRGEAQWTGTPRARPLYEWSSSLSTACTDARGRRVVHIHIYINVVWEAMRRGLLIHTEEKMKRTNARTNIHMPTCLYHTYSNKTYIITYKPTHPRTPTTYQPTTPTYPATPTPLQPYTPTNLPYIPYNTNVVWCIRVCLC